MLKLASSLGGPFLELHYITDYILRKILLTAPKNILADIKLQVK